MLTILTCKSEQTPVTPHSSCGVTGNTETKQRGKKMWKNIKRNENRARKKSGRARTNALNSMTPQGQALWAARHVENSANESLIKALDMSMTEVKK